MECQKNQFSLRDEVHYLNCAYKAPLLKSSEAACIKSLIRDRTPIEIGVNDFFDAPEQVRSEFATLVGANSKNIALIPSTSYGFSSVLNNVLPKKGGNAITIKDEFPSGYFSLKGWCQKHDNDLIVVSSSSSSALGQSWNENLLQSINEETAVVLISSVHWMNGVKFDLEAIGAKCESVGATFIVDGTQSVGALPMDVKRFKIDALVCASYKWLFGPYSLGLAFIGDKFANGKPLEEAWINRANAHDFSSLTNYEDHYLPGSSRYNVGEYSNFTLVPMLLESLRQINAWKPAHIQAYCKNLIAPLKSYLHEIGVSQESENYVSNHLFSLQLPKEANAISFKENLAKNNVYISVRGEYLRISVNVFNDSKDIDKLIEVIKETINQN